MAVECDVCGQTCPPKTLRGMKVGDVGRTQNELLNPAMVRALADGKRLTMCSEPRSDWVYVHPTDADEPSHRDRDLSTRQVEDYAERLDGWYGSDH